MKHATTMRPIDKHFANIISQTEKKENPQRLHIPRYSSPVEPKKKLQFTMQTITLVPVFLLFSVHHAKKCLCINNKIKVTEAAEKLL